MNTFAHNIAPPADLARVAQEVKRHLIGCVRPSMVDFVVNEVDRLVAAAGGAPQANSKATQLTNSEFRDYSINALMDATETEGSLTRRFDDAMRAGE